MSLLDNINNFYERLVLEAIDDSMQEGEDEEFLSDVMCVALNRLPPRYYRHKIDIMFYMADPELQEMREKVANVVAEAKTFVKSRGSH
ncbi:late competence development ComFB family protein [Marinobacter sp. V034]|uniref:late competence development ComFB family protein n=1 Tax=Marinobacter sp. V034 TaxID=3459610 RepID=UPI004043D131